MAEAASNLWLYLPDTLKPSTQAGLQRPRCWVVSEHCDFSQGRRASCILPTQQGRGAGLRSAPDAGLMNYCLCHLPRPSSLSDPRSTLIFPSKLLLMLFATEGLGCFFPPPPPTKLSHQSRTLRCFAFRGKPNQKQTLDSSCSWPIKTLLRSWLPLLKSDILVINKS